MPSINITDQDMTNIILNQSKMGATSLTNLVLESSNNSLRSDTMNILQTTFTNQKRVFDFMSQKGWYQVHNASQQDISTAKQSVNNTSQASMS